jgi:ATP-binding cassette subfamily F protein uup
LRDERTVLEEVSDGSEFVIFGEDRLSLRAYLKRFLFTDERINTQVKHLSGGERSRLLLARILKNGGNFLVLDEPTNDLDLPTLRILEEALLAFPGCVLVVSHDRYFLNRVCTGILALAGDGRVAHSAGDYDYFLEKQSRVETAAAASVKSIAATTLNPAPPRPSSPTAKPRKLSFKEIRELEGMEARITETEAEIARLEALFARPDFHQTFGQQTGELVAQVATAKAALAGLFARWEELDGIQNGRAPAA